MATDASQTTQSATNVDSLLQVSQLSKQYESGQQTVQILNGITFELAVGQNAAIVGPSGCGKSTLLYILGGLEQPTGGTVRLDGQDPFAMNSEELAAFRNRSIGFIFQDHHLLPQLTVRENVLLPALANGQVTPDLMQRSEDLIQQVGLAHRTSALPGKLSGGERQRVAVARAMLLRPRLLLADEPTGSLDEGNAARIADLMLELQSQHQTSLLCVTHSPVLADRFQRTMTLHEGQIRSDSSTS